MPTALLGLGGMGDGVARTLLSRGHALTVWNRTPARALPLVRLTIPRSSTLRLCSTMTGSMPTMRRLTGNWLN